MSLSLLSLPPLVCMLRMQAHGWLLAADETFNVLIRDSIENARALARVAQLSSNSKRVQERIY